MVKKCRNLVRDGAASVLRSDERVQPGHWPVRAGRDSLSDRLAGDSGRAVERVLGTRVTRRAGCLPERGGREPRVSRALRARVRARSCTNPTRSDPDRHSRDAP